MVNGKKGVLLDAGRLLVRIEIRPSLLTLLEAGRL